MSTTATINAVGGAANATNAATNATTGAPVESGNYIFRAKTKEAFVIKILSELLHNASIKFAPLRIDNEGIHLCEVDANKCLLINFSLKRESFGHNWKCTKPQNFQVNCKHFHLLLKSIKKKDTITLFIKDDDICKLGICVETSDENNKTNTFVRIQPIQPVIFSEPTGYPDPTIISNREFQKMKTLHNISKKLEVTCTRPGMIKFFCDGGEIYEREVVLGLENEDDEMVDETFQEYRQTFATNHITGLSKAANQSGNVHIFVHPELPLKIKMKAGNLGDLTVFIKSKERIELEQKIALDQKKARESEESQTGLVSEE